MIRAASRPASMRSSWPRRSLQSQKNLKPTATESGGTSGRQKREWRILSERMKMGEPHVVPLSTQAVELSRKLEQHTGNWRFLFPSHRTVTRPVSENTINAALRRLGYSGDEMTGHGFRSLASTCLNEQGWHPDLIELQLAHAERNKVRAAYNRASRLMERHKMMQALGRLPRRAAIAPRHYCRQSRLRSFASLSDLGHRP